MREEVQKWHLDALSLYNQQMFDELLYEHDIVSDNLKTVEFEYPNGTVVSEDLKGYFAKKDRRKYWLDEEVIKWLPVKVGKQVEELKLKDDVILRPLSPVPFKITPKEPESFRGLVDGFAPFTHSEPLVWNLLKIIGIAGYVGKAFVCLSSQPEFGKSSIYDILHSITNMSPVFKPRSVPGVLNKITGCGNMVFDDVLAAKKDVRDIMEEFNLQIGGGKSQYINGALKAHGTKTKYGCQLQSITYLFNDIDCYAEPEKRYFDNVFDDNKAIDSRFLKLKFSGVLSEKFSRNFNLVQVAKDNRMLYVNLAKELLWLQLAKQENKLVRRYDTDSSLQLKGRRRVVYAEISLLLDLYCTSQGEYNGYISLLDEAVIAYREMVNSLNGVLVVDSVEEDVR